MSNKIKNNGFVYLASPYTHVSKEVMHRRFEKTLRMTSYLIKKGYCIFSPIVYCHVMAGKYTIPTNWEYWLNFNKIMLLKSNKLMVLTIRGWKQSRGVKKEIELARNNKIPIEYIEDKIKKKIKPTKCTCLHQKEV